MVGFTVSFASGLAAGFALGLAAGLVASGLGTRLGAAFRPAAGRAEVWRDFFGAVLAAGALPLERAARRAFDTDFPGLTSG